MAHARLSQGTQSLSDEIFVGLESQYVFLLGKFIALDRGQAKRIGPGWCQAFVLCKAPNNTQPNSPLPSSAWLSTCLQSNPGDPCANDKLTRHQQHCLAFKKPRSVSASNSVNSVIGTKSALAGFLSHSMSQPTDRGQRNNGSNESTFGEQLFKAVSLQYDEHRKISDLILRTIWKIGDMLKHEQI